MYLIICEEHEQGGIVFFADKCKKGDWKEAGSCVDLYTCTKDAETEVRRGREVLLLCAFSAHLVTHLLQ